MAAPHTAHPTARTSTPCADVRLWSFRSPCGGTACAPSRDWFTARAAAAVLLGAMAGNMVYSKVTGK